MHAGTAFMPFYRESSLESGESGLIIGESIDLVLSILTAPSNESHRQLIGRAIECGSIIGMSNIHVNLVDGRYGDGESRGVLFHIYGHPN